MLDISTHLVAGAGHDTPDYVTAPRDGGCTNGFVGDLESLRISNLARYLG